MGKLVCLGCVSSCLTSSRVGNGKPDYILIDSSGSIKLHSSSLLVESLRVKNVLQISNMFQVSFCCLTGGKGFSNEFVLERKSYY